jgi:hypothetical protein
MLTLALSTVPGARSMVALATAVALLLPLPARCAACSAGADRCQQCASHVAESLQAKICRGQDSDSTNQARPCCQRHTTADSPDTASFAAASAGQTYHPCGCGVRPVSRTNQSVERFSASPELSAGLVSVAAVPPAPATGTAAAGDFVVSLAPSIPHRILHCSWII